jgi:hypothetical protein
MSSLAADSGRGEGQIEPFQNNQLASTESQKHDRFVDDIALLGPPIEPESGRDHNGDIDITAGQKMLSAMSGSLLTSLIGMH